jgi:hypothetical protein
MASQARSRATDGPASNVDDDAALAMLREGQYSARMLVIDDPKPSFAPQNLPDPAGFHFRVPLALAGPYLR